MQTNFISIGLILDIVLVLLVINQLAVQQRSNTCMAASQKEPRYMTQPETKCVPLKNFRKDNLY